MNLFEFYATLERYHTIMNPTSPEKLDLRPATVRSATECAYSTSDAARVG